MLNVEKVLRPHMRQHGADKAYYALKADCRRMVRMGIAVDPADMLRISDKAARDRDRMPGIIEALASFGIVIPESTTPETLLQNMLPALLTAQAQIAGVEDEEEEEELEEAERAEAAAKGVPAFTAMSTGRNGRIRMSAADYSAAMDRAAESDVDELFGKTPPIRSRDEILSDLEAEQFLNPRGRSSGK